MTNQEINERVAAITGFHDKVGLKKRGYWYRPNASGYTACECEAGRYTLEEAKKHEYKLGDEPVTIHRFTTPNYTESLDACREFESAMNAPERAVYADSLVDLCGNDSYDPIFAPSTTRCEAFLRLKGQWK